MKRFALLGLLIALTVAMQALPCTAADEPVLLRMNMKAGEIYRMLTTMDQTIVVDMPGMPMETKQIIAFGVSYAVDSIAKDGSIFLSCTYETLSVKISSLFSEVSYDSQTPDETDTEVAGMFGGLVGAKLQLKMAPTGRVLECKGLEEVFDKMLGSLEPEQREATEKSLAGQFNFENLFGGLEQYPEYPIQAGDSWNTVTAVPGQYPMTIRTNYTLRESRSGMHLVDVVSDIVCNSIQTNPDGGEIEIGLKGTQTGVLEIDAVTGWLIRSRLVQKITGEMTMELNGQTVQIPMSIQTTAICEPY